MTVAVSAPYPQRDLLKAVSLVIETGSSALDSAVGAQAFVKN
jgi:hypothetical protein